MTGLDTDLDSGVVGLVVALAAVVLVLAVRLVPARRRGRHRAGRRARRVAWSLRAPGRRRSR